MDLFALSIPIKVSGKQQATAELQAIGRVGQQVAKDISLSFSQTRSGLLVPAQAIETTTKRTREFASAARAAEVGSMRYARAAFQISGVLTAVAASGNVTAGQMTRLVGLASSVAFAFGPTGAIVGAIGLSILAIGELFKKTTDGMEDLKAKAIKDVHDIFRETNLARAEARKQEIELAKFEVEQELIAPTARRDELIARRRQTMPGSTDAQIAANILHQQQLTGGEFTELTKKINELQKRLKALTDTAGAAATVVQKLAADERTLSQTRALNAIGAREMLAGGIAGFAGGLSGDARAQDARVQELMAARDARLRRPTTQGIGAAAAGIAGANQQKIVESLTTPATQAMQEVENIIVGSIDQATSGIAFALADGFAAAFSGEGFGPLLEGFTASLLSSLGGMFIELGKHFIAFGTIMESIKDALTSFFGAGPGAIVGGLALIALGAAMTGGASAIMSGRSARGAGSTSAGSRSLTDSLATYSFNPMTMKMTDLNRSGFTVNNFTIIGPNDPSAQRQLGEVVRKEQRRGGV